MNLLDSYINIISRTLEKKKFKFISGRSVAQRKKKVFDRSLFTFVLFTLFMIFFLRLMVATIVLLE